MECDWVNRRGWVSIINDALKKAQQKNKSPDSPTPQTQGPGGDAGSVKNKPAAVLRPKKTKFISFIIIVIIGIGIAAFFIKKPPAATPEKIIPNTPVVEENLKSVPPPPGLLPALNLNGIVYDEERPYAIINNKVLLKGDTIEGATLMEINRDNVKFMFNDREIVLNAK